MQANRTFLQKMVVNSSRAGFHTSRAANQMMTVRESIRTAMTDEMRRD